MPVKHAIIPCLRYADAPAAIEFLCDAFGFTRRVVYPDDEDSALIHHAQLVLDGNMIMLATAQPTDHADAAPMLTVAQAGGNTQAPYIIIDDVDAHAERARAAGADIFSPPAAQDFGGRLYSARDPEGNSWSFGSYDPFAKT